MAEVTETQLPGVGVRHEFTTDDGTRIGVITHRSGRREVLVYDDDDPDVCRPVFQLSGDDARTVAELLGATRVSEVLSSIQYEIEGLAIDWIRVAPTSPFAGRTIGDGMIRTRTGVSIVAVIREGGTVAAPEPTFEFRGDDVVVAVGTGDGLEQVREILAA
jgi:TrkA domain protein